MGYQYQLKNRWKMNLVTRLKSIEELKNLSQLGIDVFSLDTPFTTKKIHQFTIDEIKFISKEYNVYLLMNRFIHEADLEELDKYFNEIKDTNIKGIIVSELTVYVMAKKYGLDHLIIYQPGTMNTDTYSEEYFNTLNIKGITISRELTLNEIKQFGQTKLELSLIGHGYIDMFYSKRKLITHYKTYKNMKGFIPRDNYSLTLNEEIRPNDFYPVLEDNYGTHIYRSKKLSSYEELNDLNLIINDFFIERIFLTDEEFIDSIKLYKNKIALSDFNLLYKDYDKGFYYRRTEKIKGERNET